MYINSNFTNEQYVELREKLKYSKVINREFLIDVYNGDLNKRIVQLIPKKYIDDDRENYYVVSNIISAWINLIREWIYVGVRKDIATYIYWARVKRHPKHIKIGITYDVVQRSQFENNKYYDYHVIRWCKNRYSAAYLEYKIRTLYCTKNSEIIELEKLNEVCKYVRNFHYSKENKKELEILGWRF